MAPQFFTGEQTRGKRRKLSDFFQKKAARWRTDQLEAAWSIADLRAAVEHGMELEAEEAPEEAGAALNGGVDVDQDEVMA